MKNTVKLIGIIALAVILGFSMAACDNSGGSGSGVPPVSPPPPPSDVSQLTINNNENAAVTTITPNHPIKELWIEPGGITPMSNISSLSKMANLSVVSRSSTGMLSSQAAFSSIQQGITFPANMPIMIFFNDLLLLPTIQGNVVVTAGGQVINGIVSLNKGHATQFEGAILTFTPSVSFQPGATISITIKKGMQNQGGFGMADDWTLTYTTSQGASGSFTEGNGGFEQGESGVRFVGDGSRMKGVGPLQPFEGEWLAAISTGDKLVSAAGMAVGGTMSSMILGPINKNITRVDFHYNFISAEFNEYINAGFDDTAMFTITGPNGSHTRFITSVDDVGLNNIPFVGFPGMPDVDMDNYAGQTDWKHMFFEFTSVGSPAFITFMVTDVGDAIVSSILAIDKIEF